MKNYEQYKRIIRFAFFLTVLSLYFKDRILTNTDLEYLLHHIWKHF